MVIDFLLFVILFLIFLSYLGNFLVAFFIVIILWSLVQWSYQRTLEHYVNTRPDSGPSMSGPFRGYFNEPAKFINFCLTDKPRGNNGPYPIYNWWKYKYNNQLNQQYKDCDKYRCVTPTLNGFTAKPGFSLKNGSYVDPDMNLQTVSQLNLGSDCGYYENPVAYCNKYPKSIMCPNNWITPKHPVRQENACDLWTPNETPAIVSFN